MDSAEAENQNTTENDNNRNYHHNFPNQKLNVDSEKCIKSVMKDFLRFSTVRLSLEKV